MTTSDLRQQPPELVPSPLLALEPWARDLDVLRHCLFICERPPPSSADLTLNADSSLAGTIPELPGQASSTHQGLLYKIIDFYQNSENAV